MIPLTTNNGELQWLISVPEDVHSVSISKGVINFIGTVNECQEVLGESLPKGKFKIMGTFNKGANEIDFMPKSEWVEHQEDKFFKNYNGNEWLFSASKSYLSLLQSLTKESEHVKFVVLKEVK